MVYSVREVPLSHPVRSANIRIFGTFVLRQIRLKEHCVLQGVFLVWPPSNLTKSQALVKTKWPPLNLLSTTFYKGPGT